MADQQPPTEAPVLEHNTRPTADVLAITERIADGSRTLHFGTDQGPVLVRIPDAALLGMFGQMLTEEAREWLAAALGDDDEAWDDDDDD